MLKKILCCDIKYIEKIDEKVVLKCGGKIC